MAKEMGERLTHLVLSDNKLVGIPQIITALSVSMVLIYNLFIRVFIHLFYVIFYSPLLAGKPSYR